MAKAVFEFVAEQLGERTDLEKLEARGTVRIALKEAGLDARSVTAEQMAVVVERRLPSELEARGVDEPTRICTAIAVGLEALAPAEGEQQLESPEEVFRRLGGRL